MDLSDDIRNLKNLKTELYQFQINTLHWMKRRRRGILALEMGSGKTLIALVHFLLNPHLKIIYICQKTVSLQIMNYINEHITLSNNTSDNNFQLFETGKNIRTNTKFLIINYDKLRSNMTILNSFNANTIFLDEVCCRNLILNREYNEKFCMTGTPIINSIKDLKSLTEFLEIPFTSNPLIPIWKINYYYSPEIILTLPIINIININISMTFEQSVLYDNYRKSRSEQIMIVKILRLKQLSIHPKLVYQEYNGKSNKFLEINKIISHIDKSEQIIIFSQYSLALKLLHLEISDYDFKSELLIGSGKNNSSVIESFKEGKFRILLANMIIGSTGLNLQNANNVIFLDSWWNDSLEKQAIARVYRLGQRKPVKIFKIFSNMTIESYITETKTIKNTLISDFKRDEMNVLNNEKENLSILLGYLTNIELNKKYEYYNNNETKALKIITKWFVYNREIIFTKIYHPNTRLVKVLGKRFRKNIKKLH